MTGGSPGRSNRVAVVIGRSSVWAVEAEVRAGVCRLVRRGAARLSHDVWDDLALHAVQVAAAIREALTAAGIKATSADTCVPRRLVTAKVASLPRASADMVEGMVRFEAQQYVPWPLDDAVLGHQVLSDDPADELMSVLVVGVRKRLISDLLAIFDGAGLEVGRIGVSALALAEHTVGRAAPHMLVSCDHGDLDVVVAENGRALFSRGAAIEADEADEVARTLMAYAAERLPSPASVELAGPDAAGADLAAAISAQTGLACLPMAGALMPDGPDGLPFATAAGLAAQPAPGAGSRVNLVPLERSERRAVQRKRMLGLSAVALATVVLVGAVGWAFRATRAQAAARTLDARDNARLATANQALKKAKTAHEALLRSWTTATDGLARSEPMVDVLHAVSQAAPREGGTYLTQLAIDRGGRVALHGMTNKPEAPTMLVVNLQKTGRFAEVRLGYLGDSQTSGPMAAARVPGATSGTVGFLVIATLRQEAKPAPGRTDRRRASAGGGA
ncbi:MAG: pilus assembly protein PilM [Armatimonadetes bacterium]|nr:pilus assembly protein PilM [Armatimonadota bacterium]